MENLQKLLREHDNEPRVVGDWFNIRWTPDVASGERLNIGVGVVSDGRVHVRLLDYFERVKCLYGESGVFHAEFAADLVREAARSNHHQSPLPQVIYEHKGFAQGPSLDWLLETLFDQTVTLSRKVVEAKRKIYHTISNDQLYVKLLDYLAPIAGLQLETFVPEQPAWRVEDGLGTHELFIPFRDGKKLLGGLASAVFASPEKVELNLLKAARDVETAMKLGRRSKPAVFILKPGDDIAGISSSRLHKIENQLDKFDWYMEKQQIQVGSHVTVSGLAEEIYEWAEVG